MQYLRKPVFTTFKWDEYLKYLYTQFSVYADLKKTDF